MPERCCSGCKQPYSACHCSPPDPPDVLKALFPQTPFPPRNIPRARQHQDTAEYRGEQIPTWGSPVVRNVRGYGPPASTDVRELSVYHYEAFLEQFEKVRQSIKAMQALLSPEHGELLRHERQWLYGTLAALEHRQFTLARLYVQAFEMLHDAASHENNRSGGRKGADERKRTICHQHAEIRKEAQKIWKSNPTLSTNAVVTKLAPHIADIVMEPDKKLSVSQLNRILLKKNH